MTNQGIPVEAIEAALSALYPTRPGEFARNAWETTIHTILEAAAPHMLAQDRAEVWAEGHEDGFWNGRMSSGDTSDVALIGKEHADATNPYKKRPAP